MASKPKSADPVHRRLKFFLEQRLSLIGNPAWRARAKDPQRYNYYDPFAAIVYGPGPGHPGNAVLGIRLCFQSLVINFGGVMKRLPQPRHGVEILVVSRCSSIFRGLAAVSTVQYQCLHAVLRHRSTAEDRSSLWEPSASFSELLPLACDFATKLEGRL